MKEVLILDKQEEVRFWILKTLRQNYSRESEREVIQYADHSGIRHHIKTHKRMNG